MDYNQFIVRQNRFSRKQFPQMEKLTDRIIQRNDNNHRLSQPKPRLNLIKINKNKLPTDFFLKKDQNSRKVLPNKHQPPTDKPDPHLTHKKAESEKLHFSPQKTSFFGFFDQQEQQNIVKANGSTKLYNRKFETRNQLKRDAFPAESVRKLTTATKNNKNDLLELFPPTHDQQLGQVIISSSRSHNLRLSPRKELVNKLKEPNDPEKQLLDKTQKEIRRIGGTLKVNNVSMEQMGQKQSLNITFFNAKSTCFPPINRPTNH